jgi:DNA-binding beta-propeller fold protein YncE
VNGGDFLFAASGYDGGAALVIRTSDNTIVDRIATGSGPYSVRTPADGAYVASSDRYSRTVTIIGRGN